LNSRWEHAKTFAVVASGTANAIWTPEPSTSGSGASRTTGAGHAVVPANEEVLTWDIKKGELVSRWRDPKNKSEVSIISQNRTDADIFAVGYTDGSIRLWDSKTGTVVISFNGHKSAVSALAWDQSGTRLASGGRDAHIIVWDLIAEVGLYRLRGHKDQITGLEFLRQSGDEEKDAMRDATDGDGWILSAGKDTLIKLWDLATQHCVETHVAHHGECWAMVVMPDQRGCITAGNDGEMKVWSIDSENLGGRTGGDMICVHDRGTLYRQIRDRAAALKFHPDGNYFAVHGVDKNVEIWRIRGEEEVQKALKRKRKRKEQKGEKVGDEGMASASVGDIFVSHVVVRSGGKVKSVDWAMKPRSKSSGSEQLLISCTNNSLEFYNIEKQKEKKAEIPEYSKLYSVDLPGHRTDIRSLSLSADDRMLASASNGSLKIWNVRTGACIRTFECGYALCCSFLPGDKIVSSDVPRPWTVVDWRLGGSRDKVRGNRDV
jgi:U3 small nucleolar RNA-associated protein 12